MKKNLLNSADFNTALYDVWPDYLILDLWLAVGKVKLSKRPVMM